METCTFKISYFSTIPFLFFSCGQFYRETNLQNLLRGEC